MKILVIDPLTQTWEGETVRSGLQKSALLDVKALSTKHDVSFAFCGTLEIPKYNFEKIILSHLGTKDLCLLKNQHPKHYGHTYIPKLFEILRPRLKEFDLIILHIHTLASLRQLNKFTSNKNILVIIHDIIDLFWYKFASHLISELKKNQNNNIRVYTNSQYNLDMADNLHYRNKKYDGIIWDTLPANEVFDGFIKHFVWTDLKPEILDRENYSSIIGRYDKTKYHQKLFGYKNPNHHIRHYGVKDPIRDPDNKFYDKLLKSGNIIRESLSDHDLFDEVKKSHNIIIPNWNEGFGYTAFEAGIFGAIPIVLHRKGHSQATAEYLTRCDVFFHLILYTDKKKLFNIINESIDLPMSIRKENSNKLLNYFTLENYISDRLKIFGYE